MTTNHPHVMRRHGAPRLTEYSVLGLELDEVLSDASGAMIEPAYAGDRGTERGLDIDRADAKRLRGLPGKRRRA